MAIIFLVLMASLLETEGSSDIEITARVKELRELTYYLQCNALLTTDGYFANHPLRNGCP